MGTNDNFFVVGIGASAGGQVALQEFFEHLPPHADAAFVVVTHLARDHESQLPEIIARHAALPVIKLSGNDRVERNHIYVLPENALATINDSVIHLTARPKIEKSNHAVDVFLNSLAKDCGDRAIGVIFSGAGSDGSEGVRCIHKYGGKVLVQAPESAAFAWMPESAIDADSPDLILSPAKLAQNLPQVMAVA